MDKYYLSIFNTCTGMYEEVEVTEAVYHSYRRMNWCAEKKEQEYRKWCIPFSSLKAGDDGAFQNFHEFASQIDNPEIVMMKSEEKRRLYQALKTLTEDELRLIFYLFYMEMSEAECAERYGNSQQAISKRKHRILCKIAELVKKFTVQGCETASFLPIQVKEKAGSSSVRLEYFRTVS